MAMLRAVKYGEAGQLKVLAAEGHDITAKHAEQWTVLHHAAHKLDHFAVRQILEIEARTEFLNAKTDQGFTALMYAARLSSAESSVMVARELLEGGCDVNVADESEDHRTALYLVVEDSKTDTRQMWVELLLDKGARIAPIQKRIPKRFENYPILAKKLKEQKQQNSDGQPDAGEADPSTDEDDPSFLDRVKRKVSRTN